MIQHRTPLEPPATTRSLVPGLSSCSSPTENSAPLFLPRKLYPVFKDHRGIVPCLFPQLSTKVLGQRDRRTVLLSDALFSGLHAFAHAHRLSRFPSHLLDHLPQDLEPRLDHPASKEHSGSPAPHPRRTDHHPECMKAGGYPHPCQEHLAHDCHVTFHLLRTP